MNKEKLIEIANDTVKISKNGTYKLKEINYDLITPKSELIEEISKNAKDYSRNGEIIFLNESVVDTIVNLRGEDGVCVLNFASAKNPGGGFLKGTVAQEECLARSSNMYITIKQYQKDYYDKNREENNPLYTDTMIWSDNVTFFKDANFNLIEPSIVSMITSPAVNAGVARNRNISEKIIEDVMENRIRKIIHLAANKDIKTLILGKFGCGVFKNNEKKVAKMFKKILEDEEMKKYFDKVIFSIYDKKEDFERFKSYYR